MSDRYALAMKDLPPEERPRERLAKHGPEALSTPELLAILLRTGTARESALDVAEGIVAQSGGLRGHIQRLKGSVTPAQVTALRRLFEPPGA